MAPVIGITDNMDWFNNTYENQRQISGLIITGPARGELYSEQYRGVEKVDRIQVTISGTTLTVDARFQKTDPDTGAYCFKKFRLAKSKKPRWNSW